MRAVFQAGWRATTRTLGKIENSPPEFAHIRRFFSLDKTPPIPLNSKLGPGPLPSHVLTLAQDAAYWAKFTTRYKIPHHDGPLGEFGELDGVLHRDPRVVKLTQDTQQALHKYMELPEDALLALQDGGGHGAAYNAWINLLTKDNNPVVVLSFGAFGEQWANDIKEISYKGDISKVVTVKVDDGKSPTISDIESKLQRQGLGKEIKFNITATTHETGTGVELSQEVMEYIADSPRIDVALLDITSGLGTHNIPGLGETVSAFGALQKTLRAPAAIGVAVVAKKHKPLLEIDSSLPLVKFISWSERQKDGSLAINKGIFDGSNITRSMAATDIAKLNKAIYAANLVATPDKTALQANIEAARISSAHFQAAVSSHIIGRMAQSKAPILDFLVKKLDDRGAFNVVLVSGDKSIDTEGLQKVKALAWKELADENRAINIQPFPKGDSAKRSVFRLTTSGLEEQQAQVVFDNLLYAYCKAKKKVLGKDNVIPITPFQPSITLIAEDQFLYKTQEEVDESIANITAKYKEQGKIFVDGRNCDIDYNSLLKKYDGQPVIVYKPDLQGEEITAETDQMRATGAKTAIIVAAKNVPESAKTDVSVRQGAGVNNFPDDGRPVQNCPGVNSEVTARNTLNAIAGADYIEKASQMAYAGQASATNLEPLYGKSPEVDTEALNSKVKGKIVTILGTGNIGAQTIKGLLATEVAQIRIYGRSVIGKQKQVQHALGDKRIKVCDSIDDAMQDANVVVNHLALVPGPEGTEGIIGAAQLAKTAKDARIVDAARAGIIDPKALMNSGRDVVVDWDTPEKDPRPEVKEMYDSGKFIYLPHMFADTDTETRLNMMDKAINIADRAIQKSEFLNVAKGQIPEGSKDVGRELPPGIGSVNEWATNNTRNSSVTNVRTRR